MVISSMRLLQIRRRIWRPRRSVHPVARLIITIALQALGTAGPTVAVTQDFPAAQDATVNTYGVVQAVSSLVAEEYVGLDSERAMNVPILFFDLAMVPSNASVTSATLRLYLTSS